MKLFFKWTKPWYLCVPRHQFWAYYDEVTGVYFCFARFGKREYQGESVMSFERAYERLSHKVSVGPLERFVVYSRVGLLETYNDSVNIF